MIGGQNGKGRPCQAVVEGLCRPGGIERLAAPGCEFQAADLLCPSRTAPNRWGGRLHAAAGTEPAA